MKKRAKELQSLLLAKTPGEALALARGILRQPTVAKGAMWNLFPGNKGTEVPLLLAHLDTVRKGAPKGLSLGPGGLWIASDGGVLGADDRAGVAVVCWTHLLTGWPVLLTDGEEVGGLGAHEIAEAVTYEQLCELTGSNISCLVQVDRHGCGEVVSYDFLGDMLAEDVALFAPGWRAGHGTYTDVATLGPVWDLPAVNLAAGYFGEHFPGESLLAEYTLRLPETIVSLAPVWNNIGDLLYGA